MSYKKRSKKTFAADDFGDETETIGGGFKSKQKSAVAKAKTDTSTTNDKGNKAKKPSAKRSKPEPDATPAAIATVDEAAKPEKKAKKLYIVFVGNLSFDTTTEQIQAHFQACGTCTVRILTNKITGRSKGCAFVEFEDASHHEKALKYDQQKLKGRKINVEPTAGGGGKSTKRKEKLQRLKTKVGHKKPGKGRPRKPAATKPEE